MRARVYTHPNIAPTHNCLQAATAVAAAAAVFMAQPNPNIEPLTRRALRPNHPSKINIALASHRTRKPHDAVLALRRDGPTGTGRVSTTELSHNASLWPANYNQTRLAVAAKLSRQRRCVVPCKVVKFENRVVCRR